MVLGIHGCLATTILGIVKLTFNQCQSYYNVGFTLMRIVIV